MLKFASVKRTNSLEHAYRWIQKADVIPITGATTFLAGGAESLTAVDISGLLSHTIAIEGDEVVVAAGATLREVEKNEVIKESAFLLAASVMHMQGPAYRNVATIGGNVCGRFGKSEPLTVLLAYGAKLRFFAAGEVQLSDYLAQPVRNDILLEIRVPVCKKEAGFYTMRNGNTEYAVLSAAVRKDKEKWMIAMGARPYAAKLFSASTALSPDEIGKKVSSEADYGDDLYASGEYRSMIAPVVIKRAIERAAQ